MSLKENDTWVDNMYELAQQAIAGADHERVLELTKELSDHGYVFAANMVLHQWEEAGNVDVK